MSAIKLRADLLSLTDDDIAALTNRGTAKRARREADAGELAVTWTDELSGDIVAAWSDSVTCVVVAGKPLSQGKCSCPAEPPCVHLARSVFAYQQRRAIIEDDNDFSSETEPETTPVAAPATVELPAKLMASARKKFDDGQLFELTRGARPTARCHSLGTVTRFLVPGDINFTVCDCGQNAPCEHALMALWAFERLPIEQGGGFVDTRTTPYPVPADALAAAESILGDLLSIGLASLPDSWPERRARIEAQCRKSGLIWPAEAIAEIGAMRETYAARDSRFDPAELASVVAELQIRCQSIAGNNNSVPPLLVRGAPSDTAVEIGSAMLTGLGCLGKVGRRGVTLQVFGQDENTGQVVTIVRQFERGDPIRPLPALGKSSVARGISLADAASGRLLVKGARRSPSGVLSLGRSPATCYPQAFSWEKLRAPVLIDSVDELVARLADLPPASLRPRRLSEDFVVLPVKECAGVGFDPVDQAVVARVLDTSGTDLLLWHPFVDGNGSGCDALVATLSNEQISFVAGRIRSRGGLPILEPSAVVTQKKTVVLPWISESAGGALSSGGGGLSQGGDRLAAFLRDELQNSLGEALVSGLSFTIGSEGIWREIGRQADALGFVQIPALCRKIADGDRAAFQSVLAWANLVTV